MICLFCGGCLCISCCELSEHYKSKHNNVRLSLSLLTGEVIYETKDQSDLMSVYENEFMAAYTEK